MVFIGPFDLYEQNLIPHKNIPAIAVSPILARIKLRSFLYFSGNSTGSALSEDLMRFFRL